MNKRTNEIAAKARSKIAPMTVKQVAEARTRSHKAPELIYVKNDDGSLSIKLDPEDEALGTTRLLAITGTGSSRAANLLLDNLMRLAADDMDKLDPTRLNWALSMMAEIGPKDGAEGMLAAQMIAVHTAAMRCFSNAGLKSQTFAGKELNLKFGSKLTQIYAQQVAALDKHRRKGQQTVNVKHVHVNEGGQAVIGNVSQAEGV